MANYYVLLTDHGKSFIANAQANSQLALTHVVLGDANDQPYLPESRLNQTKLVHQTSKLPVASVKVINNTTAEVSAVVPSNVGGFNVHEVGITDSSGKLVYIGNFHGGYRPTLTEGAGGDMELVFTITADNLATVVIEMDNYTVSATRGWVTESFVTKPEFQAHLDGADPHSQYLNKDRFQLLLQTLIPLGYQYDTHTPSNPKPMFDELLGIATHWRRITGKIMLATDPNDAAIKDHSVVLGQHGMTELANSQRPHVYPLQTSHKFERYNPDEIIETVWKVVADKNSINEGDAVRFTVTANNIPDGQVLNWSVKEGVLNSTNNDISNPSKTDSGTVILQNGQAIINFTTTPDDNTEEPQKHVRLSIGAPANLSINVPINDAGHHETVIHISQSTINGIDLAEYYRVQSGSYPASNETVRFIVDDGVDIIASNTATPALIEGANWPVAATPIVENHGRILGRGGDGGRSARIFGIYKYDLPFAQDIAIAGSNGGTAIKSLHRAINIENYSLISGGGGGGGGMGAWVHENFENNSYSNQTNGGGGGAGGGAPFGSNSPNDSSLAAYMQDDRFPAKATYTGSLDALIVRSSSVSSVGGSAIVDDTDATKSQSDNKTYLFYNSIADTDGKHKIRVNNGSGQSRSLSCSLIMSQPATKDEGGIGGSNGVGGFIHGDNEGARFITVISSSDIAGNHGGNGGDLGESGKAGNIAKYFNANGDEVQKTDANMLKVLDSASGGLAGYIKEGNVTINNLSGGITKGR